MKKEKFTRLIELFMGQAGFFEKVSTLEDILDNPKKHHISKKQAADMKDVLSFVSGLYFEFSDMLRDALVDVFTGGEDMQKEYLGFAMDLGDDKESMAELFDILFKQLFTFTGPALKCTSADRVSVFLNTLKKELES